MTDVTLKDYIAGGFWSRIRASGLCPLPEAIPNLDSSIDSILRTEFGQRKVRTVFVEDGIEATAKAVVLKHSEKWNDLFELSKIQFNLAGDENTTVSNGVKESVKNTAGESVNKTSTFDSDAMVDDTGSTNSNKEDGRDTDNVTKTQFEKSLETAAKNLQYKFSLNIINAVSADIVNLITLKIY